MTRSSRGPMREPSYYVLAALLDGPRHGYVIIGRARDLSSGRVRLAAGTLYSVLDRLLGEGLISVTGEEIVNGRARRYYELTESGRDALAAEADRMAAAARVVIEHRRVTSTRTDEAPVPTLGVQPA